VHLATRTAILVAAVGLKQAITARPLQIEISGCTGEYKACMAAGYDPDMCRDTCWRCRYGGIPVKVMATPAIDDPKRRAIDHAVVP